MARLSDVAMLELARSEALAFCQDNPDLNTPQHSDLAREMGRVWQGGGEWS